MRASGAASHIFLGMPAVGLLGKPHSERPSTNLFAWGHASYADWDAYAPYTRLSPYERDALLDQDLVAWMPQLGGDMFAIRNRFHFAPSLRIKHRLVATEVLRAVSSQRGTLGAVAEHVRAQSTLALPPAPIPAPNPDMANLPTLQPPAFDPPRFKAPPPMRSMAVTLVEPVRQALVFKPPPSASSYALFTSPHPTTVDD